MRKVSFDITLSLDGCCDHTKLSGGDDEVLEYFTRLFDDIDLFVFGRKTYQFNVSFLAGCCKKSFRKDESSE